MHIYLLAVVVEDCNWSHAKNDFSFSFSVYFVHTDMWLQFLKNKSVWYRLINIMCFSSDIGLGEWLCECPPPWVDRSDIWVQTTRASSCRGSQCVPSSVLRGQCWHLLHRWSSQEKCHHWLHQQFWPDSKTGGFNAENVFNVIMDIL